jgi:hypothetical protein
MQPFIMSLSLCLLGSAVCVLTFAAAMGRNDEEESESATPPRTKGEQFFLDELHPAAPDPGEPADAFLLRLRAHVRLEQEAAKAFLDLPNSESLYAPTESPLWH